MAISTCGNRVLSITEDLERLAEVGEDILWNGARDIRFEISES